MTEQEVQQVLAALIEEIIRAYNEEPDAVWTIEERRWGSPDNVVGFEEWLRGRFIP